MPPSWLIGKSACRRFAMARLASAPPARGGGSRKTLDEKILHDLAWSTLTVIYSRNKAKLPVGPARAVAIFDYLAKPGVKERLMAQAAAIAAIGEEG